MRKPQELAREIVPDIISMEAITEGESGSSLFRIKAEGGKRLVLKITRPETIPSYLLEQYPQIGETEYYFYKEIFPYLELPGPLVFERDLLQGGGSFIFFSDISETFFIPSQTRYLKRNNWERILRSFAHIHGFCQKSFQNNAIPSWLNPPLCSRYTPVSTISTWEKLAKHPLTCEITSGIAKSPGLLDLAEKVQACLEKASSTLLHNDFFPGNIALPLKEGDRAAILDWQLSSSGPGSLDLVQMDLEWDDNWLGFYHRELCGFLGENISLEELKAEFYFSRLLSGAIFLPVILKAAHRNNKEGKKLSPWMLGCLQKFSQDWKKALGLS